MQGKEMAEQTQRKKVNHAWNLLLVLPYLGLLFPQWYAKAAPALWGFPFFYWYQFAWVIASASLTGLVYLKTSK